ncbi:hypothetical protein [Cupriavidus campinensis]
MLSPHEIAALLVLRHAAWHRELDPNDLGALVELDLVRIDAPTAGPKAPRLTAEGQRLLRSLHAGGPAAHPSGP